MSKTAITTTPNVIPVKPSPAPPLEPRIRKTAGPVRQAFQVIASLRVTVVLFVIGVVLVFLGTLAQMDEGIWTVVGKYFRSMLVWVPWQLFVRFAQVFFGVSPDAKVGGSFPFPGGWLIGSLLLVNLLAAHAVRFRLAWRRSGILILHAGMVIMMLGELITGLYQVVARREGVGVEANQREDAASVRVTFKKKSTGEPLGSYLLSVWCYPNYVLRQPGYQFEPQQLKVDGKTYQVELRPKREYKPYTIYLKEFKHDVYIGTTKPKNYSSLVRVFNPSRQEERDITISMNDPLRTSGDTLYQSGSFPYDSA